MRWQYRVNDIIRQYFSNLRHSSSGWDKIEQLQLNTYQLRHLHNLSKCHTERLGGRLQQCNSCGYEQYIYHSCRNRHCPSCQGSRRKEWIAKQQEYLLDVPYFHVVFTLPEELNRLCLYKPRQMYNLLFKSSWETIRTLSKDRKYLGAESGMTAVLHTWGSNLSLHPHLHCIIPGGGITKAGKWKHTRTKGKYLFPVKVIKQVYRAIFLKHLKAAMLSGELPKDRSLLELLYKKQWVVYCKRPFASPNHVIEYLGRYTHKVGISNYRLICYDNDKVSFKWKDYRDGAKVKVMTLSTTEFLRRFALHILPHRFVRIRHYGVLSYHGRSKKIPVIQKQQNYKTQTKQILERPKHSLKCNMCSSTAITISEIKPIKPRAP